MRMSRRFIQLARAELDAGRRLQGSEKTWGATAHALKAVATQRGWRHRGHDRLGDISVQIAMECNRPDLHAAFEAAETQHRNFYNNEKRAGEIRSTIDHIESMLDEWERVLSEGGKPYKIENAEDQARLRRLTGQTYSIEAESSNGFVVPRRAWRGPESGLRSSGSVNPRMTEDDNDDGTGGSPIRATPRGNPPAPGGGADVSPQRERATIDDKTDITPGRMLQANRTDTAKPQISDDVQLEPSQAEQCGPTPRRTHPRSQPPFLGKSKSGYSPKSPGRRSVKRNAPAEIRRFSRQASLKH